MAASYTATLLLAIALTLGATKAAAQDNCGPLFQEQECQQADDSKFAAAGLQRTYSTATVIDRPISSTTSAVFVIERKTIEALAAHKVADLLRFAPGVHLLTDGSRSGSSAAQIRGGDPNFTLVLLDGIPLNDSNDQQGGTFNLNSLSTETIERIEVVSGPLSAHFGSTGLAGAINIITRAATNGTTREAGDSPWIDASIETGSASLVRAATQISSSGQSHNYSGALQYEREQGRIGKDRFKQFEAQARLSLRLGSTIDLQLKGRFSDWDADDYPVASGGPILGSGELRRARNEELSLRTDLTIDTSEQQQTRAYASIYRHTLDRHSPAIQRLVPASNEAALFTRTKLGTSAVFRSDSAGFLNAGVDLTVEHGSVNSVLFLPPFLGGALAGDYDILRTLGGPYAELVQEIGNVIFELGARLDFSNDVEPQLSPRFGIAYRASPTTRIRASVGRAFKLPSFFALASPRALGGNSNLRPETSWGADVGLQREWHKAGITLGIAAFYNSFSNLIDFDFQTFQNVNRKAVETYGVETSIGWRIDRRLNFDMAVTRQGVDDLASPDPLLQRPEWLASVRATWQARDRVLLAFDTEHVAGFFDWQLPAPDRTKVSQRTLLGLSGSWQIDHRFSVIARADNLANATYETLIGFPGPSRSIRVGARYTGL